MHAVREALGMSRADLGQRMGVSVTSVLSLEQREREGKAQVDTLRRAAEALECDLVYALVPRRQLETIVSDRAALLASRQLARLVHSMALEGQAVLPDPQREQMAIQAERLIDRPGLWRDG